MPCCWPSTTRSQRRPTRLRLGDGETFHGEGILAVTKALLQSGVSYVGGYQGAPVSHLMDVLVDAEDIIGDLGVHLETCTNEASAAAMLGASINYPLRGAVTWKSIVGTNVASDALSNLASPGVVGGALIVVGEDYGEGASVVQERTYAFALKSSVLPPAALTQAVQRVINYPAIHSYEPAKYFADGALLLKFNNFLTTTWQILRDCR